VADDGEHRDAAVLELDLAEAVEPSLEKVGHKKSPAQ
jgi:hypothetical protein